MSAVVLPFPSERRTRAKPFLEGCGFVSPTLEGRVRAIGYHYGLPTCQREALVALHRHWLNIGIDEDEIIKRAGARARSYVTTTPPGAA